MRQERARRSVGGEASGVTVKFYLDVYWLVNFVMDLLVLGLSARLLKLWPGCRRLAAGAAAGSFWACLLALVPAVNTVLFWIIGGGLMVFAAFDSWPASWKPSGFLRNGAEFFRRLTAVAGVSAAIGGVLAAAERTPRQWRLAALFSAAAGIWFGGKAVLGFMQERAELQKQCYQVILSYQGKQKQVEAFRDTGNRLYEPYGHQPVHVLSADACRDFCESVSQVIYIPYRSVGKAYGLMPGIRMDEMKVCQDGTVIQVWKQPWIAISREPVSPDNQYQLLLHE